MDFSTFVRKPFYVEAVEITKENLAEVAEFVGDLRKTEEGVPFIQVTRRGINVDRVFPGFWMTKMGDNIHCYSKRVFKQQFTPKTSEVEGWIRFLNHDDQKEEANA